jgi:hypothetical protein
VSTASQKKQMDEPDWGTLTWDLAVAFACTKLSELVPQNKLNPLPPTNPLPYNPLADMLSGDLMCLAVDASLVGGSVVCDVLDGKPWQQALEGYALDLKSLWYTEALVEALKRAIGRLRPLGALALVPVKSQDWMYRSLPSRHAARTAAIAGNLVARCISDASDKRVFMAALAEACALSVAALRVLAGVHNVEDVVVGWALAHAIALSVRAP